MNNNQYSLALDIKVYDRDEKLIDVDRWPLLKDAYGVWWRGAHKTEGTKFDSLLVAVGNYSALVAALAEPHPKNDLLVKNLMHSVHNLRETIKSGAGDRPIKFEVAIIGYTTSVLDQTTVFI